ncbi:MAG: hypothetical protein C0404_00880 [Verrucomicrobia bacterium]|nr:hypothetical protein [Verrucomicrobiota bacterium]
MTPKARVDKSSLQGRVVRLMESARRILGLPLCYHDYSGQGLAAPEWSEHRSKPCFAFKRKGMRRCVAFCGAGGELDRLIVGFKDGYVHQCPAGYTKIAAPVFSHGTLEGVLFAGPCRAGRGGSPHPDLAKVPDRAWLEDCRSLLSVMAREIERLHDGGENDAMPSRHNLILSFISANIDRDVTLQQIARELGLSPSRTAHVVKSLLGESLAHRVRRVKLNKASFFLTASDATVAEIAYRFGFSDQSHFTHAFAGQFGISPLAYRKKHRGSA